MGSNVANIAVETIEHFDELRWLILDRFRKNSLRQTCAKPYRQISETSLMDHGAVRFTVPLSRSPFSLSQLVVKPRPVFPNSLISRLTVAIRQLQDALSVKPLQRR